LAKSWPAKGPPASWWRRGSRRSRSGRASPRACEGPRRCPRSLRLVQLGFALPREHILGDDPRRSGDARPRTRPRRAENWPWGAAKPVVEHLVLARARRARSGAWPTSPIREMHRIGRYAPMFAPILCVRSGRSVAVRTKGSCHRSPGRRVPFRRRRSRLRHARGRAHQSATAARRGRSSGRRATHIPIRRARNASYVGTRSGGGPRCRMP
jgi:hypothetical protein